MGTYTGVCKWFDSGKAFGFIEPDEVIAILAIAKCCKIGAKTAATAVEGRGLEDAADAASQVDATWCQRCALDVRTFCHPLRILDIWS